MSNKTTNHKVFVIDQNETFFCSEEKSLLSGIEQINSRSINIGCRGGGCGICKVKIIKGSFSRKKMSKAHITDENLKEGIVLACRVYPTSNLQIKTVPIRTLKK